MAKSKTKKLLDANPKVEAKKLYEVLHVLRKLRRSGLPKGGYDLDIPFSKRVHARQEDRT